MEYKPTEEHTDKIGKEVANLLNGYSDLELEPIFEKYILPIYYTVCEGYTPIGRDSKWKVTNRETGLEYDRRKANKILREIGIITHISKNK